MSILTVTIPVQSANYFTSNNIQMKKLFFLLIASGLLLFINSCKDDDEPTTGFIKGTVTDIDTGAPLSGVRILFFNAETNNLVGSEKTTDAEGKYTIELKKGEYYLNLGMQGYTAIPQPGIPALSVTVKNGSTATSDYQMSASEVTNAGYISGKVLKGETGVSGSLVVATISDKGYSGKTNSEGQFYIYNVPAGSYSINAFKSMYNCTESTVDVTSGTEAMVDLTATDDASTDLSGAITFLATSNSEVNVILVHPVTMEQIPGLTDKTAGSNYVIEGVPNGTFIARATYDNDGLVVDPDWIIKNGEPVITATGSNLTQDFSVTGAVTLNSPTNEMSTTNPTEITDTVPTFSWTGYSSTSDYVIEVSDANGNVIWGGFTGEGDATTKNIIIDKSETSIEFNSDGNASITGLKVGKTYRWKIYASKDNTQEATGWALISTSEDQMGLIKIVE